jgi:hypothetical protein
MPRAAAKKAEFRNEWIAGAHQVSEPERKVLRGSIAASCNPSASGAIMPTTVNIRCANAGTTVQQKAA